MNDDSTTTDDALLGLDLHRASGFLLFRTAAQWERTIDQVVMPVGLTRTQFFVLSLVQFLGQDGQSVTQSRIASDGGLDPMVVSQVARRLEGKGWLVRVVDPADRRARCLQVTAAGREVLVPARRAVMQAAERFFATLGEGERTFQQLLLVLLATGDRSS